jgi:hypothetical protein
MTQPIREEKLDGNLGEIQNERNSQACIADKFPARIATRSVAGARRSNAGGEFVSDAGSGSGILRLRRTIPLLFGRDFKDSLFQLSLFRFRLLNRRGASV